MYANDANTLTVCDCFHFASRENVFRITEKEDLSEEKIPSFLQLCLRLVSDQVARIH